MIERYGTRDIVIYNAGKRSPTIEGIWSTEPLPSDHLPTWKDCAPFGKSVTLRTIQRLPHSVEVSSKSRSSKSRSIMDIYRLNLPPFHGAWFRIYVPKSWAKGITCCFSGMRVLFPTFNAQDDGPPRLMGKRISEPEKHPMAPTE